MSCACKTARFDSEKMRQSDSSCYLDVLSDSRQTRNPPRMRERFTTYMPSMLRPVCTLPSFSETTTTKFPPFERHFLRSTHQGPAVERAAQVKKW